MALMFYQGRYQRRRLVYRRCATQKTYLLVRSEDHARTLHHRKGHQHPPTTVLQYLHSAYHDYSPPYICSPAQASETSSTTTHGPYAATRTNEVGEHTKVVGCPSASTGSSSAQGINLALIQDRCHDGLGVVGRPRPERGEGDGAIGDITEGVEGEGEDEIERGRRPESVEEAEKHVDDVLDLPHRSWTRNLPGG